MGQPLRDMDKQQLLLEQIIRVNALAETNGVEPLNLGPLARMALSAAMHQVHDKNNEVIVVLGGTAIPWGGPLKDPAAAAASLDQSMEYTDTLSDDEGDDRPDWVPADGLTAVQIHIDLVGGTPQGRAWVAGVGEVAVDTLLGGDPNTANAWATSEYDPGDLVEQGLVTGGGDIAAFIGDARSMILNGATVCLKFFQLSSESPDVSALYLVSADGNDAIGVDFFSELSRKVRVESWGGTLNESVLNIFNVIDGAINVCAVTVTTERIDVAANGSDAETSALTEADRPPGNPLVAVFFDALLSATQSITIYDSLPSTTGLSALSETGVTNTAPTDIILAEDTIGTVGGEITGDHTGTLPVASFIIPGAPFDIFRLGMTDPEGNPGSFTLVDDNDGKFFIGIPGNGWITVAETLGVGPHTFTVRATDPGDLYVEQEFMITVTA